MSAQATVSVTLPSVPTWISVSLWVLYKSMSLPALDLVGFGSPEAVSIVINTGVSVTLDAGPTSGTTVGLTLLPLRWYHVSYAFSSTAGKLYSFGGLIQTNPVPHTMISSTTLPMSLNIAGLNLQDLHILQHTSEISDFSGYISGGTFPFSSSTKPGLSVYIPCTSLTPTNDIVVFTLSQTNPPTDTSITMAGQKTKAETIVHSPRIILRIISFLDEGSEKMATKYAVDIVAVQVDVAKDATVTGTALTIDFWVNIESLSLGGYFKLLSAGSTAYLEVAEANNYRIKFENTAEQWFTTPGKWQHIAITGSTADKLYVDGQLVDSLVHMSVALTTRVCTAEMLLANVGLKQLRVWSKPLSQAEVQQYSRM